METYGLVARPLFGYMDADLNPTRTPYVEEYVTVVPGGASSRAGIQRGDTVDLRELDVDARVGVIYQPVTTQSLRIVVHRGNRVFVTHVHPSTVYDGDAAAKQIADAFFFAADLLLLACATIIAFRRPDTIEGRLLCLTLLALLGTTFSPSNVALGNGRLGALLYLFSGISTCAMIVLPVVLAARFGVRAGLRRGMEIVAYATATSVLVIYVFGTIGLIALSVDPVPFLLTFGSSWSTFISLAPFVTVAAVALAVAATPPSERPRAAWLLIPLPFAYLVSGLVQIDQSAIPDFIAYLLVTSVNSICLVLGAGAVTFAIVKRRVLDIQFIVARALVVAVVSSIVVVSFILLEWALGTFLSSAGRITGLVANAGLALVLGLSMHVIHGRVDGWVERALFHKRRENEHKLRAFAKEAMFVTERDALLDRAIGIVQATTDARSAAFYLDGSGSYQPVRSFGEIVPPRATRTTRSSSP